MALEQYGGPPEPDYEIRSFAGGCPCGCQDAGRDEAAAPLDGWDAYRQIMGQLGIGGVGHEPGDRP